LQSIKCVKEYALATAINHSVIVTAFVIKQTLYTSTLNAFSFAASYKNTKDSLPRHTMTWQY